MNRIRVPSGSVQNLETVFDNLQNATETNITNRVDVLIGNFGLLLGAENGVYDDVFKVQMNFKNNGFSVNSGTAITPDGEHIEFEGSVVADAFTTYTLGTGKYYLIKVSYEWVGSDAVTAQNAFMYNSAGTTPYSTQYTTRSDSYLIELVEITSITSLSLDNDELALGVVKTLVGNTFDITAWTLDGYSAANGVIDVRSLNRLTLDENVVDDSVFMLKDRDSIGSYKVDGKVEIGDDFYVDTNKFFVDKSEGKIGIGTSSPLSDIHIKTTTPTLRLHDSDASTLGAVTAKIDFYKGDETAVDTWADYAGYIGFTSVSTSTFYVSNDTEGDIILRTVSRNETQKSKFDRYLTFTNEGYLGVNTNAPEYGLDVRGSVRATDDAIFGNVDAYNVQTSGYLSVSGITNHYFDVTIYDSDLELPDTFKVDSLTGYVMIGSSDPTANLHIRNTSGAVLKLDASATTPTVDSMPYIELSAGASSPSTFIMALNPSDNSFRIDSTTAFSNNHLVILSDGKVGLSTETPSEVLEVLGNIKAGGVGHQKAIKLSSTGAGQKEYDLVVGTIPEGNIGDADDIGKGKFGIYDVTADSYRLTIDKNGNIGIGINNPSTNLHVSGSARITDDLSIEGDVTATDATFSTVSATTVTATNFNVTNTVALSNSYLSDTLSVTELRWASSPTDTYADGGFEAGITSSGWITAGASTELSQNLGDEDSLRVYKNLRVFGDPGARLSFSEDTTSSGIALLYTNSELFVRSEYGDHAKFYADGGDAAVEIDSLTVTDLTVSNLNVLESTLDVTAITVADLTVPSCYTANASEMHITAASTIIDTLDVGTMDTSIGNFNNVTISGALDVNIMVASGLATFGDELSQSVQIDGANGRVIFTDTGGTEVLRIDDDILSGDAGLKITGGGVIYNFIDGSNYVLIKDYILAVSNTTAVSVNGISTYEGNGNTGATGGIYTTSSALVGGYQRRGIAGTSTINNAGSNNVAVGVYGDAQTTGTGEAWAGFFDDGNVYVTNDLQVATEGADTGKVIVGSTAAQRIEIDGDGGNLEFYDANNTKIVEVTDSIYGSSAGIGMYGSSYSIPPDPPAIILEDSVNVSGVCSVNLTPYDVGIGNRNPLSARCIIAYLYSTNSTQDTEVAWFKNNIDGDTTGSVYDRRILKLEAKVDDAASNDTIKGILMTTLTDGTGEVQGVNSNAQINNGASAADVFALHATAASNGTGDSYALYATATNTGSGDDWAGYFNDGNVYVANDLTVNGTLTMSNVVAAGPVNFGADAEATDAYVITLTGVAAYATGMTITFSANTANTGACSLNVNSLGAKTIKKLHDQDLVNGDIEAGQIVVVVYDGTNFQMTSQLAQ